MSEDVTVPVTVETPAAVSDVNEALQQAAPIVAELAANPAVVAALAVQGFEFDTEAVRNVNAVLETATSTVTVDATTVPPPSFFDAAVESVETEAVQVEQTVVAEVEKVVAFVETEVKEGFVAGEHLVRKALDVVVGSSRIKNPA